MTKENTQSEQQTAVFVLLAICLGIGIWGISKIIQGNVLIGLLMSIGLPLLPWVYANAKDKTPVVERIKKFRTEKARLVLSLLFMLPAVVSLISIKITTSQNSEIKDEIVQVQEEQIKEEKPTKLIFDTQGDYVDGGEFDIQISSNLNNQQIKMNVFSYHIQNPFGKIENHIDYKYIYQTILDTDNRGCDIGEEMTDSPNICEQLFDGIGGGNNNYITLSSEGKYQNNLLLFHDDTVNADISTIDARNAKDLGEDWGYTSLTRNMQSRAMFLLDGKIKVQFIIPEKAYSHLTLSSNNSLPSNCSFESKDIVCSMEISVSK